MVTSIHTHKTGLLRWETNVEVGRITYTFQAMTRRRSSQRAVAYLKERNIESKA